MAVCRRCLTFVGLVWAMQTFIPLFQAGAGAEGGSVARGFTGSQAFNAFGATKEKSGPCDTIGGGSDWFVLESTDDKRIRVSTEGSDFDTVLAVYASQTRDPAKVTFADLVPLGCNDNCGSDVSYSVVVFQAKKGVLYYVAVDGKRDAKSHVKLDYVYLSDDAVVSGCSGGPPTVTVKPPVVTCAGLQVDSPDERRAAWTASVKNCSPAAYFWGGTPPFASKDSMFVTAKYSKDGPVYASVTVICDNDRISSPSCQANVQGGPPPNAYRDIGLRLAQDGRVVKIAVWPAAEKSKSPLRIYRSPDIYGVVLVERDDTHATKALVKTDGGVKAMREYTES